MKLITKKTRLKLRASNRTVYFIPTIVLKQHHNAGTHNGNVTAGVIRTITLWIVNVSIELEFTREYDTGEPRTELQRILEQVAAMSIISKMQ